jgi:hypothetical protein
VVPRPEKKTLGGGERGKSDAQVEVSVEERGCSFGLEEALGSSRRVYAHTEAMEGLDRRWVRMCEPYRELVRVCAFVKIRELA